MRADRIEISAHIKNKKKPSIFCVRILGNQEHVRILLEGPESYDKWRIENPEEVLDLSGEDLRSVNISDINFTGANLSGVNLMGKFLDNLDFSNADLSSSLLINVIGHNTNFQGANLSYSKVINGHFHEADFKDAILVETDFFSSDFFIVNMSGTDLSGAYLEEAIFIDVNLSRCNFTNTVLYKTTIADSNMAYCEGLDRTEQVGPSNIGTNTLTKTYFSESNHLTGEFRIFCTSAGLSSHVYDAVLGALGEVNYFSAFVSYGSPDEEFATRLVGDLRNKGITCWLYCLDSTPGKRTWREISEKRREADKFVVLCSSRSLIRNGVLKELENQIDEDIEKIIPISLDDVWEQPGFLVIRGARNLKPYLLDRNYADFKCEKKFEASFEKLLRGLERSSG